MAQSPKSFQQTIQELWELLKAYAAQETIGPLKNLGRQIGFGIAGSVCVAFGVFLLVLGVMRWLQTHWSWSMEHDWFAYFVAVVLLVLVAAFMLMRARGRGGVVPATPASSSLDSSTGTGSTTQKGRA